jgi:hypothetical protein
MALGPAKTPRGADRAGEGPYLPRLQLTSEPVPEDEARAHPGGGAEIPMRCVNCERASEVTLVLSPEEAKSLGLHALRNRPENP